MILFHPAVFSAVKSTYYRAYLELNFLLLPISLDPTILMEAMVDWLEPTAWS
jgi:hypothetical protein